MIRMNKRYLGLDIGGTKCAALLGERTEDGLRVLSRLQIPTRTAQGPEQTLSRLFDAAELVLSGEAPDACGVSCGGPLNSRTGEILSPPNLPGWDRIPITRMVRDRFGVPAYLQNDANACALAEWLFGAGRGCRDMVFLTFGTGLGAGIIAGGRLLEGASGMAGEVGHIRLSGYGPVGYGKTGSFEGFCSGGGMAQLAAMRIAEKTQMGQSVPYGPNPDVKTLAEAARQGDALALSLFRETGHQLGCGLSVLVDLLNPEKIVIGSIFARCEDLLRPEMEKALRAEALGASLRDCTVVPAGLGETVGDFAALCVAAYGEKENVV